MWVGLVLGLLQSLSAAYLPALLVDAVIFSAAVRHPDGASGWPVLAGRGGIANQTRIAERKRPPMMDIIPRTCRCST